MSDGAKALVAILALPVVAVVNGWALSVLWGWYVTPLGVLPITKAHAYGLAILISVFKPSNPKRDQSAEDFLTGILALLLTPALAVFIGWVVNGMWMPEVAS